MLITAYGDVQMAVQAIKAGATDFVLKPWDNEKLLATVFSAMKLRKTKLEINSLRDKQKEELEWEWILDVLARNAFLRALWRDS